MQGGLVRRKLKILIARPRLHCMQRGKNLDRSFFHFVTMHAFDRQTDSFLLTRPPGLHSMQRGKNVGEFILLVWHNTAKLRNTTKDVLLN